jgi:hypothetical protein
MSIPAAIASVATTSAVVNPMDVLMGAVNSNPYFIGIMMLLLNLGGRFLSLEISKEQEKFLSKPVVRRFFLFAVLFVATRNIVIAACLTILVILMLGYLFNENSELCIWRSCLSSSQEKLPEASYVGLTSQEVMIYKSLQDKLISSQKVPEKVEETVQEPSIYHVYIEGLRSLINAHTTS